MMGANMQMPGFAAFHVGIQATEKEITKTVDDMDEAPANHSSELSVDNERIVVESEEKMLKLDRPDSLLDSE